MTTLQGMVLEREGSTYRVATDRGEVRAVLRGKAKRGSDRVVAGDRVRLDGDADAGELGIIGVEERRSLLERRRPGARGGRGTRAVVANVDRVFVVTASADPAPVPQLIDRLLVVAESNHLPAAVVLNKADLDRGEGLAARIRAAGYEVFLTSAKTGEGMARLREGLAGNVSVVTGPSGAGKSSLLNVLQPGLRLRVGEISERVGRGINTTVGAVMVPIDGGGFLVDTPGFNDVGLWGIDPVELASCFPDFRPFLSRCKYPDCHHRREPGCAVLDAVQGGGIARDRWESYVVLRDELENAPKEWE